MIFKDRPKSNFTIIPNDLAQGSGLSMAAKGLLLYLLSLPAEWVIRLIDIKTHFPDGKSAISTAMKELIGAGYVYREGAASRRNVKFYVAALPHTQAEWQTLLKTYY
jgi:hypothetical protein